MTPEQRELLQEARDSSGKKNLQKMSDKLERINETLKNNAKSNS